MSTRLLPISAFLLLACVACGASSTTDAPALSDVPLTCPADPPADGAPCTGSFSCTWERCPLDGVHTATCAGGTFAVTDAACDPYSCESMTCDADQLCVVRSGGAFLVDCEPNPCGDGPVTEACACATCAGNPCTVREREVTCNTCPSGLCP